jgi:hypothetical protein
VFRVQCLCVSPPSDLRLQRTTTPRRVRRPSFGLSRLAVSLTLSASSVAPAALLDSAWHRLLLHSEPGAVVVVVLSPTRTTHLRTYNTRGSYGTQQASKQASKQHIDIDTAPLADKKAHCNAFLIQARLAQRPTFFVQAVRHILRPAGWLGGPRKNHTPARTRSIE